MDDLSPTIQRCIDECLRCYQTCFSMAMNHCLEMGGEHIAPSHFRLMLACSEVCRTSAHLMLARSDHAQHLCRQCAEICDACAIDCERVGGMEPCVAQCRACAEACKAMAG